MNNFIMFVIKIVILFEVVGGLFDFNVILFFEVL